MEYVLDMEPGFFLSYWRPWDENSSLIDSWGDYLRDTSLIDYGAEKIGGYIKDASREQIYAIEQVSQQISQASDHQSYATIRAANIQSKAIAKMGAAQVEAIQNAAKMIGYKLGEVNQEISFLNRRMDIVIEQQRVGLMLQDNIAQLLKIPDSEKERQQAITLGIQFFVNAAKDPDLFDDALEEFLKAESLKKQDYFVLHRIGSIYMFTAKHLDVQKALDYFLRAGKYASVESDPSALRLANILTNSINSEYTQHISDTNRIKFLAADSFEKAALASYILGDDESAISYQNKAVSLNDTAKNHFNLGKYLARNGEIEEAIKQIDTAVKDTPQVIDAVLCDIDMAIKPKIIDYVENKVKEVNMAMDEALDIILNDDALFDEKVAVQLCLPQRKSYAEKLSLIDRALSSSRRTSKRKRL